MEKEIDLNMRWTIGQRSSNCCLENAILSNVAEKQTAKFHQPKQPNLIEA